MSDAADTTIIAKIRKNNSEEVRVALSEYRGVQLVDVRVFAELPDSAGERVATRKGVCMSIAKIGDLITALQDAHVEAVRRGLISAGEAI